jgi:drug/metabolite transporter (DMT)-like permease
MCKAERTSDSTEGYPYLSSLKGIGALLVASVSFGSSAILVRFATEASAVSLTIFRLSIAAVAMILLALSSHNLRRLDRHDLMLVSVAGAFLSLHFATFIFAVKETTVANATFLVNTGPVMLAILSPIVIKERTTPREVIGVLVATLGILLVAYAGNDFRTFGLGDISAIAAALLVAVYSLVGRYLRTGGVSTQCYTSYVYAAATLVSLVMTQLLGGGTFRSYNAVNMLAILGLGIIPTLVGHSLYNYSLGSVKVVTANLFPLLEPVIASILAVLLFSEVPTLVQIGGYSLILIAVAIVVSGLRKG